MALANRIAPEHLVVDREALTRRPITAGAVFVGAVHRAGGRRLRDRLEPRAADRRRGALSRRPERRRFRARHGRAAPDPRRAGAAGADDRAAGARRRAARARRIDRGAAAHERVSDKPPELYDGPAAAPEREHRRLLAAGARRAGRAARRPDRRSIRRTRDASTRVRAASSASIPTGSSLVNGLDEGIMAVAVAYLRPPAGRPHSRGDRPAAGVRDLRVRHRGRRRPDGRGACRGRTSRFALDEVLAAITPRTRVVFLTNPNNPTGVSMPLEAIRTIARRVPAGGGRVRRRGLRRVRRARPSSPSCRRFPTSSSAARSPRRTAWPGCASAR